MEAYEAAWKAHLGPAPPWKAYIEKTRHEGMERLKTAMHGELEAFSHQAGNFITRSHSEFIRQQEEKYAARAKTPPTEGSSAWAISEPEEEVFYVPTLQRLPAPPPPPTPPRYLRLAEVGGLLALSLEYPTKRSARPKEHPRARIWGRHRIVHSLPTFAQVCGRRRLPCTHQPPLSQHPV